MLSCPCLAQAEIFPDTSSYVLDANTVLVPRSQQLYRYSRSYGSGCSAWDDGLAPFCNGAGARPDYCSRPWCYVDVDACTGTSFYPSVFFSDSHFSYETCGSTPTESQEFSMATTKGALQGEVLRFAYPKESSPWHWRKANGEWDGMMHRFFKRVAAEAGFSIVERNISEYSLGKFASAWDACTHDVMMGRIDVCPTAAQQTSNRLAMADFSSAILASPMRLMVRRQKVEVSWNPADFYDSVWFSFLKPFTPQLWIVILSVIAFAAWALAYLDDKGNGRRGPIRLSIGEDQYELISRKKASSRAPDAEAAQGADDALTAQPTSLRRLERFTMESYLPSLNLAMFGFFVTDVPHRTKGNAANFIKASAKGFLPTTVASSAY